MNLLENETTSVLEGSPVPELKPPRAGEGAVRLARMIRQQSPLVDYSVTRDKRLRTMMSIVMRIVAVACAGSITRKRRAQDVCASGPSPAAAQQGAPCPASTHHKAPWSSDAQISMPAITKGDGSPG